MRVAGSEDFLNLEGVISENTPHSYEDGKEKMIEMANAVSGGNAVDGVAIGIAGPLDREKGTLLNSPHLPNWIGKPILKELSEEFLAPVFIENDTALSGLGEYAFGEGKGFDAVAYLTVSTGVGGVKIQNGRIDRNIGGFEIGHQVIDVEQMLTAEDLLSGASAEREFGVKPYEIKDSGFWDQKALLLSVLIHNTIMYWSPQIVIVGGSMVVGDNGPVISLSKTRENLEKISTIYPVLPEIRQANLRSETGLWGGMEYLRQMKEDGTLS